MHEKKRILHVHVLPVITGSGINTFLTMQGLAHAYHMEMACAPGGPLVDLCEKNGIPVRPIHHFVSEMNPQKDVYALWQLYRLLKHEKYDCIHTHNSKGGFIGRLAARLAGGVPVIHGVHGYAFHEAESWPRRALFFMLEYLARNWSARVICISQPLVDLWVDKKLAPPEKIRKIYSGIHVAEFNNTANREEMRKKMGIGPDEIVIGQVSKLWHGKGHVDIIEAARAVFSAVPRAKIVFIGDGPLKRELEERIARDNLREKILLLGHRDDVPAVTAALDIAVLASYYEGMGRVLLEAMAAGVPVVANRVGGIVELVIHNETGLLVEPHDVNQLADAITILARDTGLRLRMGEKGRQRVTDTFSAETMIAALDRLYQEVCTEYGRA
jgi:glycosyltransferase involved in cell wall biosynthesis